jgi:hypothetical protein
MCDYFEEVDRREQKEKRIEDISRNGILVNI